MNQFSSETVTDFSPSRLIPAATIPATVSIQKRDLFNYAATEFCFDFADKKFWASNLCCVRDGWLSLELLTRLAGGEEVRMNHPNIEPPVPGRLRLVWWLQREDSESSESGMVQGRLEFLPDAQILPGEAFFKWVELRFPILPAATWLRSEDFLIGLYAIWRQETSAPTTIAPDDELLFEACVENYERLVAAITKCCRIEADPAQIGKISETALGVAMENQGNFGPGPGFMSGCHRHFREDDFCLAEDEATWVPRAKRIENLLREAGAVDYSPLITACKEGNLEKVRQLLDKGYPPNFAIYGYTTPLVEAVGRENSALCRLLLDRGADPNLPRPFLSSMVWGGRIYPLAIALDHSEISGMLLDAGANPQICCDDDDWTPVVFRGGYRTVENAAALFKRIDFSSIRNRKGMNGVHFLNAEDLELCKDFIPTDLLDVPGREGLTPLMRALLGIDYEKAFLLLRMGASPNVKSWWMQIHSTGWQALQELAPCLLSPVQAALFGKNLQLLEKLIALEPNPDPIAYRIKDRNDFSSRELRDLYRRFQEDEAERELHPEVPRPGVNLPLLRTAIEQEIKDFCRLGPGLSFDGEECRARYPELVEAFDVLKVAEEGGARPHFLAVWKAGRPLNASEWIGLAPDTLRNAEHAADQFTKELAAYHQQAEEKTVKAPCYRYLLHLIDYCAELLEGARAIIENRERQPQTLSADLCEIASGEFDGGNARARKNAAQGEGVGFDDFLDALLENLTSGSTMDLGKLAQAAHKALAQLDAECVNLMRKV